MNTTPSKDRPDRRQIVVGFDRQASSRAALAFAIEIGEPLAAHLHVVHVTDLDDFPVDPDSPDYEAVASRTIAAERAEAHALLAGSATPWTYYCEHGTAPDLLSAKADEVDALMVVVGASRGGVAAVLERLSGASVSSALARHPHRPVVIVPPAK